MFSPLLDGIIARSNYPVVGLENYLEFAEAHEFSVLFFPGDWQRLGESNDVAVVLPELALAFQKVFQPAVVAELSDHKLQAVYRFRAFPALVFLRRGKYLGVITRVLDWDDYLHETARILSLEASDPPPYPRLGERAAKPESDELENSGHHFH
ncbi:hydrogenase-1 expression HyaE [Neorhizobium galegae]|uniref:Hydrogenase-1 expression HyaE n=1 Tax=Neorhizobium galegae TaxID=399 RepID=A0A6A1TJ01_NEOGA|nr:hydrogenase-1 expression HyaE [Neorhizobium galegae]KAB1083007.1 hydrogenase-1 expression HyaE [Neorhizobium galegae]